MRREKGLTLVETLVAIVVLAALSVIPLALFIPAARSNTNAQQRTLALRAAETWLDRYRASQEPKVSVAGYCTVAGSTTTCTYPYNYTYPASDWSSHTPALATIMSPFKHIVTSTVLASGTQVWEWQVTAQTFWLQNGVEKSTSLTTRVAY